MLLSAQNIAKTLGTRELFHGVSITIEPRDRVGLIGPNGAGKSTLLKLLAGLDAPDNGGLTIAKGSHIAFVPQQDEFPEGATAHQAAIDAAASGMALAGRDHHEIEMAADIALAIVGFDDAHAGTEAARLSGGWRKRLSLAAALASANNEPDLILLDEPTNHLDLDGIRWLERFVTGRMPGVPPFASVFVTHDRAFLEQVATRVVELSNAYPAGTLSVDGNYSEFLRRKGEFLDAQAKAQQATANQVRKDIAWLQRGAKARRTKEKGRITASYARMDDLAELRARNAAATTAAAGVLFNSTDRKTRKLIAAKNIAKSLGGRALFSEVNLVLGAGDCLGLLGPNGSGKTTLIRVLTGELLPDTGEVVLADPKPRIAVFSQHRREFEPSMLLRDALCPISDQVRFREQTMHITAWAKRFLFREHQLAQPVKSLSGGELARIHIARIMLEPADVLVLDEPTNDLDIPTLEIMEEALEDFPGALVLVTHDRAMLDRLASDVLALDGRGNARLFATVDQAMAASERADGTRGSIGGVKEPARSSGTGPAAQAAPIASARGTGAATPSRRKLSYKDQREYEQMEQRIHEAEAAAKAAERAMSSLPANAPPPEWAAASKRLADAQAAVAALFKRWEELETLQG